MYLIVLFNLNSVLEGAAGDRNPNDGENNANGENPADDIIGSDSDDDILVALTDSGADSDETDEMWVAWSSISYYVRKGKIISFLPKNLIVHSNVCIYEYVYWVLYDQ